MAVAPPSMEDLKNYLFIRPVRYNAKNDGYEHVFLTKIHGDPSLHSNRAIEALVKKYTKAFTSNKAMSPHKLRHTYGTQLMAQEGDIHLLMTQLGHSSTTTAALYSNPEHEKAKKAVELLGQRRHKN